MGAILLSGVRVGVGALVGAGALVAPGALLRAGWLSLGSPARPVRALTSKESRGLRANARRYVTLAARYAAAFPCPPEKK
jgi:carbonic anhydrase/acetyltransferase-like protein (isoleucine patch superfamily)